jgi:hypothetical protein
MDLSFYLHGLSRKYRGNWPKSCSSRTKDNIFDLHVIGITVASIYERDRLVPYYFKTFPQVLLFIPIILRLEDSPRSRLHQIIGGRGGEAA